MFFSSRSRHTRLQGDWSSDVCSSDLDGHRAEPVDDALLDLDRQGDGRADGGERGGLPDDPGEQEVDVAALVVRDRKSTRLNSSHLVISYAVFCLKKKK